MDTNTERMDTKAGGGFGGGWEFLGPELPGTTELRGKVVESNVHYTRRRRGPYGRVEGKGRKGKE